MMRMTKTKQEVLEAVAELSPPASKLLLVLLLGQSSGETVNQAEFATKLHTSRRSVARGVAELVSRGLICSIPHGAKYCLAVTGSVIAPGLEVDPDGDETEEPEEDTPLNAGPLETPETLDPLALCRQADIRKDGAAQVQALQAVWEVAYPVAAYPVQRLSPSAAKAMLIGHSAEFVGAGILHGIATAKGKVNYPLSYTKKVLATFTLPEHTQEDTPMAITDDLRALVRLGGQLYG